MTETWEGSGLWTAPNQRGLFGLVIRPRSKWEQGLPTFDAGATDFLPYPTGRSLRFWLRGRDLLTPDEALSLYESIPRRSPRYHADTVRGNAIERWAASHPALISKMPIAELLSEAHFAKLIAPLESQDSPLAGTYRIVIKMGGGDSITLFARTEVRPTSYIWEEGTKRRDTFGRYVEAPYGYELLTGFASELSRLPADSTHPRVQGFLSASFEPVLADGDSMVWRAGADPFNAAGTLSQAWRDRMISRGLQDFREPDVPTFRFTPGRFVKRADGSVYLIVPVFDGNKSVGTIRGERISHEHLTYWRR